MDDFDEIGRRGGRPRSETRATPERPPLYKVLIRKDDYTPMDFVIAAIETCFGKGRDEAAAITRDIHCGGIGVCGVFTYDIAETRMMLVVDLARKNQYPLQCLIERA